MKKSLIVLVALACSLLCGTSFAQCPTEARATETDTCIVMRVGEQRGVWFELTLAEALRTRSLAYSELTSQVEDYERLVESQDTRIALYEDAVSLYEAAAQESAEVTDRLARKLARKNKWYRRPTFLVGGTATVTLAVVTAFAIAMN